MKHKQYYILPDDLACYLINGDTDTIKDNEKQEIDKFLKRERVTVISKLEDSSFRHTNDLNNIGADCSTYIAHKKARKRTIDSIIDDVGKSLSGASMGRRNVGTEPTDGTKVYDCNVPLYGDYDRGGAYWGGGRDSKPLRVRYTKDLSYVEFYRSYKAR